MEEVCNKKTTRDIVLKTAGPVLIEVFLGTLFGMVDMMMLGRIAEPGKRLLLLLLLELLIRLYL